MAVLDPQAHIVKLEYELQWARLKIQSLIEELRQERIRHYGPRSETLSNLQLELLEQEPGVSELESLTSRSAGKSRAQGHACP